jgi:tryptophanyl-tRNA synthetase
MAADILLYFSDLVPVGDDQKQHLELTRDIAQKFNNDYSNFDGSDFFPIPDPLILDDSSRVMSLRDGTKKMSKSDPSVMSRIEFKDDNDLIIKKISKAKTDPLPLPSNINDLEKRPEVNNLLSIFSSLSGSKLIDVLNDYSGKQFSQFKKDLSDLLIANIEPIREELTRLDNDQVFLKEILEKGTNEAMKRSNINMKKIKDIVGLG